LGLPRTRNFLTPVERRLLERFARKVDKGELPDWLTAARQCLAEIQRRYANPSRLPPGGPRRLTSHSIHTIHTEILTLAHRLKLRGPRCVRWSDQEMKLLQEWLTWYSRYRRVQRLKPLRQASEGLQEDLEKLGSNRTYTACRAQLTEYHSRRQGAA
jgi:thiamine kinase-like enzyme